MQLYREKKDCCGCGACLNICPKQAICMQEDEYGFLYPAVEEKKCENCDLCQKVCAYQNMEETNEPLETYAAITKNTDILLSASGGIFASLATSVLEEGGVVYGASMENINNVLTPMHIAVEKKEELIKLLGSKYVQSSIGTCYADVKLKLLAGKQVLFSGTPCQIAGLKGYLGKEYETLILVDIICHGVPSAKMFKDYITCLEGKLKGRITAFKFRDKKNGWGLTGKATYITQNGKQRERLIPCKASSFYSLFLDSDIYRENCYSCKYASACRAGDITIGDYWGIQKQHPELMEVNGGNISELSGSSCIIVNTSRGQAFLKKYSGGMELHISDFDKAAEQNVQLKYASHRSMDRDNILSIYLKKGYAAIEYEYIKKHRNLIYMEELKCRIPVGIKKKLKRVVKRIKKCM